MPTTTMPKIINFEPYLNRVKFYGTYSKTDVMQTETLDGAMTTAKV